VRHRLARTPSRPGQIYLYFGPLTLLIYLVMPHGYLLDITTSYMLKNQLQASEACSRACCW